MFGQWRCPTQPPWRALTPRKAMHVLHGLVKCPGQVHRPCASKDNTTAARQILDIKRTTQIKDEDTHTLYWSEMLDIYPSRTAIFTLMGWTFISYDIKNLTEVLKLGTQTSYRSSTEHPKCDSERIQANKQTKVIWDFSSPAQWLPVCLTADSLDTQTPADSVPMKWISLTYFKSTKYKSFLHCICHCFYYNKGDQEHPVI